MTNTRDSEEPEGASHGTVRTELLRCSVGSTPQRACDTIVAEEPLEIRVHGRSVTVTMRTPGHDRELAAGFLFSEGIIHATGDLVDIAPCLQADSPENALNVFVAPNVKVDFEKLARFGFAASSCGLCGKATIDSVSQQFPPISSNFRLPAEEIAALPDRMRAAQKAFSATGGLHAAAIFDARGNLVVVREDIGRHNAVDKVLGYALLQGLLPFDSHVLLVSGRISFEIVQKSLAGRVPILCAISAPSSLAVELARESNQTLVGFLRGKAMNIYSVPQRIFGNKEIESG
jgi:FdhD protein